MTGGTVIEPRQPEQPQRGKVGGGDEGAANGGAGNGDGGNGQALTSRVPSGLLVVLALAFTVAFLLALYSLWGLADDKDAQQVWDKRTFLYQGVFSLVSAIVGALFGVSVLNPQLKRAESKVDQAQQDARQQTQEAAEARGSTEALVERERSKILGQIADRAEAPTTIPVSDRVLEEANTAARVLADAREIEGPVLVAPPQAAAPEPVITLSEVQSAIDASRREESAP